MQVVLANHLLLMLAVLETKSGISACTAQTVLLRSKSAGAGSPFNTGKKIDFGPAALLLELYAYHVSFVE